MPYIEKRITSGDILEVERYFSPSGPRGKRSDKLHPSTEKQQRANERRSEKQLWRMIHANFSRAAGDQFVTFTFPDGTEEETARRLWGNFLRRVRRYRKRLALPELKYLWKLEKAGQWHIHAVMNSIPLDDLTRLWGNGRVTASILDDLNDYHDLAAYLSKHDKPSKAEPDKPLEKKRKFARGWNGSQNLKRPEVETREIRRLSILRKPPEAPKGFTLCPGWELGCDSWGNLYQTFTCKRVRSVPDKKKGRRKAHDVQNVSHLRSKP